MPRKDFTENQKAEIYARDRATCAFSTQSLWALDYGIFGSRVTNWIDHIVPCAAGGSSDIDNGVCASDFFNSQKRDDATDTHYLIIAGEVTPYYLKVFGEPAQALQAQLMRLANVQPCDWFYNRCITGTFVGFEWRCLKLYHSKEEKRTDEYWFRSAWKRLEKYHKKKSNHTIPERGLVNDPSLFGVAELLQLESITTYEKYRSYIETLYPMFRQNYKAVYEYQRLPRIREQTAYLDHLSDNDQINPLMLSSLRGDNLLRSGVIRLMQ